MPVTSPLTPVDYLRFNEMITRIRTLEHVATERFFKGNSRYRKDINKVIKVKMFEAQKKLPNPNNVIYRPVVDPVSAALPAASPAASPGHGCNFPYCPSGGICELCGLQEIKEQLLKAAEHL